MAAYEDVKTVCMFKDVGCTDDYGVAHLSTYGTISYVHGRDCHCFVKDYSCEGSAPTTLIHDKSTAEAAMYVTNAGDTVKCSASMTTYDPSTAEVGEQLQYACYWHDPLLHFGFKESSEDKRPTKKV